MGGYRGKKTTVELGVWNVVQSLFSTLGSLLLNMNGSDKRVGKGGINVNLDALQLDGKTVVKEMFLNRAVLSM